MLIYHLEDDYLYYEEIRLTLEELSRNQKISIDIRRISTEAEFISRLQDISTADAVILDIMVRWDDSTPQYPDQVRPLGASFEDAGCRCADMLIEHPDFRGKIIFYSIYMESEIEDILQQLRDKASDRGDGIGISYIRKDLSFISKDEPVVRVWDILIGADNSSCGTVPEGEY